MLLYLDTSCMAKLYVKEPDAIEVRNTVNEAEGLITSEISFVEMHSLVARRAREKLLTTAEVKRILHVFGSDWSHYGRIPIDEDLVKRAGRLVAKHPLRALDAIHLASALMIRNIEKEPVFFLTADRQ